MIFGKQGPAGQDRDRDEAEHPSPGALLLHLKQG